MVSHIPYDMVMSLVKSWVIIGEQRTEYDTKN